MKTTVTYQSKKLGRKFQLKDKTKFHQQNSLVYYSRCLDETCNEDYVGETNKRIEERIIDHNKRDKKFPFAKTIWREEPSTCVRKLLQSFGQ